MTDKRNRIEVGNRPDDIQTIEYDDQHIMVDLCYPPYDKHVGIEVGLCAVRAADSIRIRFNYDNDGWDILQQVYDNNDGWTNPTGRWIQVAFVEAWALEREGIVSNTEEQG